MGRFTKTKQKRKSMKDHIINNLKNYQKTLPNVRECFYIAQTQIVKQIKSVPAFSEKILKIFLTALPRVCRSA